MSTALPNVETPAQSQERMPSAHRSRSVWAWAVVACVLLSGSGLMRTYQDNQRQEEKIFRERCPIDMTSIPKAMGDWEMISGGDDKLDALTMRIAGGTDHIIRAYANKFTGVSLSFLLLYGPAEPVTPHTPEVCYPSSGFSSVDDAADRAITFRVGGTPGGKLEEAQGGFRSASYVKIAGRSTIREVVYYSFRLDGKWSNRVGGRKLMRRNPGVFKLQVQRRLGERESLGQGDPIEDFLAALLAEIESMVRVAEVKGDGGKTQG